MKFKRVYIEITNICNLNCSFCLNNKRPKKEISLSEFETILKKIDKYTDYIYLHVKGEPLLHSNLEGILTLAEKYKKHVNITTNGTLLKKNIDILRKSKALRQINISLHSENNMKDYFEEVFDTVDNYLKDIYVVYRIWIDNNQSDILSNLKKRYGDKVLKILEEKNILIKDKIYLNKNEKFIWPDINNDYYEEEGRCLGLDTHIAILVDGSISICCLDTNCDSNLGNIFEDDLEKILNSEKVKKIKEYFNNNKSYLEICKHCSYKKRFKIK